MTLRELEYEYARLREKAYAERDERARAAYAAVPRLKEIDDERRFAAFSLGERLYRANDPERERAAVAENIARLNEEENAILAMHRLEPDFLKPRYRCALCSDTGYVGGAEKTMCRCMQVRLAEGRFEKSHIHPGERFETFRDDIYTDEAQKKNSLRARRLCEDYAEAFPHNEPKSLLLMGNSGLGKSFLLNCIANRVYERGHGVYKLTAYTLIETVMQSIRSVNPKPDFLAPELLIIDDLGTEQMIKNITAETLFSIVNERQTAGRATLVATNLSREKLMDFYGERLYSRLIAPRHCAILKLEGKNLHIALR
ncbi:MAG: ATP-binding protein [Eubacteriales bacterium]|nr:ATP-binding protein [Eubacteriales bacterium]